MVIHSLGLDGEDKELLYTTPDQSPLHAICVEDAPKKRKDKAFIIGMSVVTLCSIFVYISFPSEVVLVLICSVSLL